MPALVLFGRRWRLGSDDLAIPVAIYLLLHIPAILILSGYYIIVETSQNPNSQINNTIIQPAENFIKNQINKTIIIKPLIDSFENSELKGKLNQPSSILLTNTENLNITCNLKNKTACEDFTFTYANCINLIYITEFFLEFIIICISCKGSIIEDTPRNSIHKFIYFRVFIGFLESVPWFLSVCLLIMPCRILPLINQQIQFTERCTFLTIIILFQLAISSICYLHTFLLFFFSYDSTGRDSTYSHEKSAKIWDRRLRFLFCCIKLPELDLNPDDNNQIHINIPEFDSEDEEILDFSHGSENIIVQNSSLSENNSIRKTQNNKKVVQFPDSKNNNNSSHQNTPLLKSTTSTPAKIKKIRQDHGISKKAGEMSKNFDIVQAVARMFSMFFKDVNLVPSDFIAALLLYRKRQKEEKYQQKFSIRHILRSKNFVDKKLQADMLLYLQYCQAIYGEMLYIFDSVMMGPQTTKERLADLAKFKPFQSLDKEMVEVKNSVQKKISNATVTTDGGIL